MATPEEVSGEVIIADPELEAAVAAGISEHEFVLTYVKRHKLYVDQDTVDAIRQLAAAAEEQAAAAREEAAAALEQAAAAAKAAARDPQQLERLDIEQVRAFNGVASRVLVLDERGPLVMANFGGSMGENNRTQPDISGAVHLTTSRRARGGTPEGRQRIRGGITMREDVGGGARLEYAFFNNNRWLGLETTIRPDAVGAIEQAVLGNPGILHQHMARIARNQAGTQIDPGAFALFRQFEPSTPDFAPDATVVFRSTVGGELVEHTLPIAPITPEEAAQPQRVRQVIDWDRIQ